MKDSMRNRLERLAHRLIELDALLSEPEIASDMDSYRKLTRERAELDPVVAVFNLYVSTEGDLGAAQEMMKDDEMREMGEEEFRIAKDRIVKLEDELQVLLLPKDPDDSRSVYLEIRAGAGGDESAIFTGDLLRMYSRYAEQQGWRVELISSSDSEMGAIKR